MPSTKILAFNVDFCFDSDAVDRETLKVLEVNPDNLARYDIAQRVGVFPRKLRFHHIKARATERQAKLFILYHPVFETDFAKAQRWGVETKSELDQKNYYKADAKGIKHLGRDLAVFESSEVWVVLLSVYRVDYVESHLYSDQFMIDAQVPLQDLLQRYPNVTFIGIDDQLDQLSNDKILTAIVLEDNYQPDSTVIINGDVPSVTCHKLSSSIGHDIVFKSLNEYAGLGIVRRKGLKEINEFLENLCVAPELETRGRLSMSLPINENEQYWISAKYDNAILHCQKYIPGDVDSNGRKITYRAVITLYCFNNSEVLVDIETIYPKKSNIGDFLSRKVNDIEKAEIDKIVSNAFLKKQLTQFGKNFAEQYLKFSIENIVTKLMATQDDAYFMKGIITRHEYNTASLSKLTEHDIRRIRSIAKRLIAQSYQAFKNLQYYFESYVIGIDFSPFKNFIVQLQQEAPYLDQVLLTSSFLRVLGFMSQASRKKLVEENILEKKEFSLLRFIANALFIKKILIADGVSKNFMTRNRELYFSIHVLRTSLEELIGNNNLSVELFIVLTLRRLKDYAIKYFPKVDILKVEMLFDIQAPTSSELIAFFRDISIIPGGKETSKKTIDNCNDKELLKVIRDLASLKADNLANVVDIEGTPLVSYQESIVDKLLQKIKIAQHNDESVSAGMKLFMRWMMMNNELGNLVEVDLLWPQRNRGIFLLTEDLNLANLINFCSEVLSAHQTPYCYYKVMDIVKVALTLFTNATQAQESYNDLNIALKQFEELNPKDGPLFESVFIKEIKKVIIPQQQLQHKVTLF